MKTGMGVVCCLLCLRIVGASQPAPAQEEKQKSENFSAIVYLPSVAGRGIVGEWASASVDLHIKSYTTDEEAQMMSGTLVNGGPDVLLWALEEAESKGKITLNGRIGFYDLKLIRSRPTETGRRIYAVGHRPIGFLEAYFSGKSMDYQFGILILDLKKDNKGKEKGEGVLIYAAKVKVLDGNRLDIENYGINPVRLMGLRKL